MNCPGCFHYCELSNGGKGYCGTRTERDGEIVSLNYGEITGLALDPIEKKPLARFHPGSYILSLGSWGCNMRCPWERNGGITFDDFVDAINDKLGDKESKEGIRRIFDLFIDDPNADTITLSSLKKISKELGENMSDEELKDMLERASKNGVELTFEEFYDIMTKKSFP